MLLNALVSTYETLLSPHKKPYKDLSLYSIEQIILFKVENVSNKLNNDQEEIQSKEKVEYQDIITIDEIDPVKVIKDKQALELLNDSSYNPILAVLRKGPLTVKDIEKKYNAIADTKKSDKTIYRYLKVLQEAGLVVPAGQRVVIGKTATETLFSRTAVGFLMPSDAPERWNTEKGIKIIEKISKLLALILNKEQLDTLCIKDFMLTIANIQDEEIQGLFSSSDEAIKLIEDSDFKELGRIITWLGILIAITKKENIQKELQKCIE